MAELYLGFDAGTQSVKVAVYTKEFKEIASVSKATDLSYPKPGWVQMDPDAYVSLTLDCIKECVERIKRLGFQAEDIQSIMGDGIICGICGVDAEGNAITPYINYLDSRTQEDADSINARGLEIFAKETGNPEALCLFPALFARWFIKNSNEFNTKGVKFMHNAPYILLHLAGLKGKDAFIDWGTMSGWGLGYKVEEKTWSEEQLALLGIKKDYMPRIVKPWDIVGTVSPQVAQKTGLSTLTKVCAGAGDTMQSMLGCGLFSPGKAVDVAGTCAMFCVSTKGIVPELSQKGQGFIFNSGTLPDSYFYWGFIRTGGLALRWFKDNICQENGNAEYYRVLSEEARKVPAGCNGVLFLPYLTGGKGQSKDASGAFLNLSMDDNQFVMWRSVLEAIGYDYIEITDAYKKAGVDLSEITVTEGGSRDSLWNQMKADMLGSRVKRFKTVGGALVTDAIVAAKALNAVKDIPETLTRVITVDETYEPDRTLTKRYRALYQENKELLTNDLKAAFARLKAMREL